MQIFCEELTCFKCGKSKYSRCRDDWTTPQQRHERAECPQCKHEIDMFLHEGDVVFDNRALFLETICPIADVTGELEYSISKFTDLVQKHAGKFLKIEVATQYVDDDDKPNIKVFQGVRLETDKEKELRIFIAKQEAQEKEHKAILDKVRRKARYIVLKGRYGR